MNATVKDVMTTHELAVLRAATMDTGTGLRAAD